jgi:hypothetical protein
MADMGDKRYLKRRGESWNFRLRVPADLQKHFNVDEIIRPLRTRDLREAQQKRWAVLAEYQAQFDRLRGKRALTSAEVEAAAQEALVDGVRTLKPGDFSAPPLDPLDDPSTFDEGLAGMEVALDAALDGLHSGDYTAVKRQAAGVLSSTGAAMPEGTAEYRSLCHALLAARAETLKALIAAHTGKPYAPPDTLNPKAVDPLTGAPRIPAASRRRAPMIGDRKSVSAAAAAFVLDRQRDPDAAWSTQTELQNEATYRLFAEYVKDCPISDVTRGDVAEFLDGMARINK